MLHTAALVFAMVSIVALAGCSKDDEVTTPSPDITVQAKPPASASGTIAEYLTADSDLSTFSSIIGGTDLATTLAGTGPYTVFAPTNAAFAALPAAELDSLRTSPQLLKTLDLHVAATKLAAADLIPLNGKTISTLGGPVHVVIEGSILKIGGAAVTRTDVLTSNGVIHLIGAVITPATA